MESWTIFMVLSKRFLQFGVPIALGLLAGLLVLDLGPIGIVVFLVLLVWLGFVMIDVAIIRYAKREWGSRGMGFVIVMIFWFQLADFFAIMGAPLWAIHGAFALALGLAVATVYLINRFEARQTSQHEP